MHCSQLLLKIEKSLPFLPSLTSVPWAPSPPSPRTLVWDHQCKVSGTVTEKKHFSTWPPASTNRLLSAQWDVFFQVAYITGHQHLVLDPSAHTGLSFNAEPRLPFFCSGIFFPCVFLSLPRWHFWCFHKMPSTALPLLFFLTLHWWPSFCQALIIILHNTWYSLALPEITWWCLCIVSTELILVKAVFPQGFTWTLAEQSLRVFFHDQMKGLLENDWIQSLEISPQSTLCPA